MLTLSDSERVFLTEMRGIGLDANGQESLVGLTVEESVEYLNYVRSSMVKLPRNEEADDRYLKLNDKYEGVRLATLFAEVEAREHKSPKH